MWPIFAITLFAVASLLPAPSHAQDRPAARRAFDEATRQFEAANHQLALDGFIEARRLLEGDARAEALILFNIARAQEELQLYQDALRNFQEYLDTAPSDAPYRELTLDRVRDLRARLARSGASSGGTNPAGRTGGGGVSPLGPVVLAGGTLMLLAGAAVGVAVLAQDAELAAMCSEGRCPEAARGLGQEVEQLALAADILVFGGAAVAAVGLLLTLTIREEPAVTASCTPNGCGLQVRGRF